MRAKTITKRELIKFMDTGERFKLVDVLSSEHFSQEHIKGAISLPQDEIEKRASRVLPDKNERIIVYCASFDCQASTNAARKLQELGYTDLLDYKGGLKSYKETGRRLEGILHKEEAAKKSICSSCFTC